MGLDELQILRAAVRTANVVFAGDELVNVAIDALPAKALATLAALDWFNHDVLAQAAVKESIVLVSLGCSAIFLLGFADLVSCQGGSSLKKKGTCCILLLVPWNKLRLRVILSHRHF